VSLTNRALFVIERNLNRDLSLGEIAKSCDVSRFHLAHAFGEATGLAVMQYVRGRRLTEAAYALASGADDILSVALEYGYASHEAFTRAFKSHFGRTPEEVRKAESVKDLTLVNAIRFVECGGTHLEPPRIERLGEMKFVGLSERHVYGETEQIPGQWRRFMAEYYPLIENKTEPIPAGITTRSEIEGELNYICAAEVSCTDAVPKGLVKLTMAPATYAVFAHNEHITRLHHTFVSIWNEWLPASGKQPADAPSFERHNPSFDPRTGEGGVTIWIPIVGCGDR